jgi:hypothetical protein
MTVQDDTAQGHTTGAIPDDHHNAHPAPSAPAYVAPSAPPAGLNPSYRREFPDPFYCPITEHILEDPVVIPDGNSYERSAILDSRRDVPSEKIYSNRALKAIIDEAVELSGGSLRAGLKRFDKSVRSTFQLLLEKSALPSHQYHPLPEAYYCSITFNLMHAPVIDPDGNTYERVAIEKWIQVNGKSPVTRTPLTVDQLYPNHAISDLLDIEKNRSENTMHPSIRKFKAETPPQRTDAEMGANVAANGTTTTAATTPTAALPTTQAEIDALRDRENEARCGACACVLAVTIIVLFVPFGMYFVIGLCIFLVCVGKNHRGEEDR